MVRGTDPTYCSRLGLILPMTGPKPHLYPTLQHGPTAVTQHHWQYIVANAPDVELPVTDVNTIQPSDREAGLTS